MPTIRWRCAAIIALASLLLSGGASAVVGPTLSAGPLAAHLVMVLYRSRAGSGFCSGVVVGRQTVLTAGHCVADASALAVYAPAASGPNPLTVDASTVHPLYRADGARTRQRSIDLALVHLAEPLPAELTPAQLSRASRYGLGATLRIVGFGESIEGSANTGGALRVGLVQVRAPLSSILLWLEGAIGQETGACEGDSGGATFDSAGELAAIIDWVEGDGMSHCGALTQSALVAPQRAWIATVSKRWHEP